MIKVNGTIIEQKHFPDNSLFVKFNPENDSACYIKGSHMIEWYYENDAELFTLICAKRHLDRIYGKPEVILIMPYIPHARMDRVKDSEDIFTLKYFCEVINSLNFQCVCIRDAHSNVSLALLENVYEDGVKDFINKANDMCGAEIFFFPDEGAMKRYSNAADKPYAFGMKKRDWKTGKILGLDVINADLVKDKDVLIIDDICSRGGTFYHSAKALKAAGAKNIYLYVTHCENTILDGDLLTSGLVEKVYTTNSIFRKEHEKVEVITL